MCDACNYYESFTIRRDFLNIIPIYSYLLGIFFYIKIKKLKLDSIFTLLIQRPCVLVVTVYAPTNERAKVYDKAPKD